MRIFNLSSVTVGMQGGNLSEPANAPAIEGPSASGRRRSDQGGTIMSPLRCSLHDCLAPCDPGGSQRVPGVEIVYDFFGHIDALAVEEAPNPSFGQILISVRDMIDNDAYRAE